MQMHVNGIDLHVEVTGSGEPLLLLHGFTGSTSNWDAYIASWSKTYQVIAVDIIGHGRSDAPEVASRYSMELAAHDLASVLDQLGIEKAYVLGYSMGGRLALSFAIIHPSRVNALLLESASPGLETSQEQEDRVKQDEKLAVSIEEEGMEAFVERWENIPLFASVKKLPEERQNRIRQQRLQNRMTGLANSLRGMGTGAQPSWWNKLGELHFPVLLLAGELDEKFVRIAKRMESLIPKATLKMVNEAGHMIHVEQPEIFDTIVRDYLSSIRRQSK